MSKISNEIEMGEEPPPHPTPQMNLIQMARIKVAPKIPFAFLKTHINECDHISSDVGPIPCSWIFQIFKQELGIKFKPLFELKLKLFEF